MNQVVTKEVHWHSHAVKSLCFSVDGSYLLSGGQEVLKNLFTFIKLI